VLNCVPLFVAVGTRSRSWEMAHHYVLVHLEAEISVLALGFRKEELRSCHAAWQSPHMAAMFFLLPFTQNMYKPCFARDPCQGGTRCIWHVRLLPITPRDMSHRRLAPTTWNGLDRQGGVISGLQCARGGSPVPFPHSAY
jgi:hypothetical protein